MTQIKMMVKILILISSSLMMSTLSLRIGKFKSKSSMKKLAKNK